MKYLLLIFPTLVWAELQVTPISHYPTTGLKTQLMLISQDTPSTPVVYKKFTAGSLRSWIDSSAMDSAGCQSKINCDSTGNGTLMRSISPTTTGNFTASTIRSTSVTNPASGSGIELNYDPVLNIGYVLGYNRTASTYRPVDIFGSSVIMGHSNNADISIAANGNITLADTLFIGALGSNNGYLCYTASNHRITVSSTVCPTP